MRVGAQPFWGHDERGSVSRGETLVQSPNFRQTAPGSRVWILCGSSGSDLRPNQYVIFGRCASLFSVHALRQPEQAGLQRTFQKFFAHGVVRHDLFQLDQERVQVSALTGSSESRKMMIGGFGS